MQTIWIFLITTFLITVFLVSPIEMSRPRRVQRKNELSANNDINNNKLSRRHQKFTTAHDDEDTSDEDAEYLSRLSITFNCKNRPSGFYADIEHNCTVFHICIKNQERVTLKCSNGSAFNQQYRICDWKYNFKCNDSEIWVFKNEKLYPDADRQTVVGGDDENSPEYDIDIK